VYSYGQPTGSQAAGPASQEGASGGSLAFGVYPEVQPPPQAPSAEPAGAASTAVDDVQSPPRKSERKKAPVNALKASDLAAPAHPKKGKDKAGDDVSTPKKAKAKAPEKASPEMPSLRALRMRQRAGEGAADAGSPPSPKSKSRKQKDRRQARFEKRRASSSEGEADAEPDEQPEQPDKGKGPADAQPAQPAQPDKGKGPADAPPQAPKAKKAKKAKASKTAADEAGDAAKAAAAQAEEAAKAEYQAELDRIVQKNKEVRSEWVSRVPKKVTWEQTLILLENIPEDQPRRYFNIAEGIRLTPQHKQNIRKLVLYYCDMFHESKLMSKPEYNNLQEEYVKRANRVTKLVFAARDTLYDEMEPDMDLMQQIFDEALGAEPAAAAGGAAGGAAAGAPAAADAAGDEAEDAAAAFAAGDKAPAEGAEGAEDAAAAFAAGDKAPAEDAPAAGEGPANGTGAARRFRRTANVITGGAAGPSALYQQALAKEAARNDAPRVRPAGGAAGAGPSGSGAPPAPKKAPVVAGSRKRKRPSAGYRPAAVVRQERIKRENAKAAQQLRFKCKRDGLKWRQYFLTVSPERQLEVTTGFHKYQAHFERTAGLLKRQMERTVGTIYHNQACVAWTKHNIRFDRFLFVMNYMKEGDGLFANKDHKWVSEEHDALLKTDALLNKTYWKDIEDAGTTDEEKIEV